MGQVVQATAVALPADGSSSKQVVNAVAVLYPEDGEGSGGGGPGPAKKSRHTILGEWGWGSGACEKE